MAQEGESAIHAHKHRIKTPLILFIAILLIILFAGGSLFYIKNKPFIEQKIIETSERTFQVDHLLLKILLKEKEFSSQEIRILNTGNVEQEFFVSIGGLQDIVSLSEQSFSLGSQQTKIITAQFSALDSMNGVEHQPGVYVGMLKVESKSAQDIPLIVEIESSQVLFDTNLNPVALESKIERGEEFIIEVRLFNLQTTNAENVDMRYTVKDMRGSTLLTEQETVVVKTQASFFKTIVIPESVAPGTYIFIAESRVGGSVGTSSYLFEVIDQNAEQSTTLKSFCVNDPLCQGLSIALLVLFLAIAAYFYLFVGAFFYQKMSRVISPQSVLGQQQKVKSRLAEFMEQLRKNQKAKEQYVAKEQERMLREQERLAKIESVKKIQLEKQLRLEGERKKAEIERQRAAEERQRGLEEEQRQRQEEEQRKEQEKQQKIREAEQIKLQEQRKREAQERIKRIKTFWREQGKLFSRVAEQLRKAVQQRREGQEAQQKEKRRLAVLDAEKQAKEDARRQIEEQKQKAEAEKIRGIEERKMRIEVAKRQKAEEKRKIEEEEYRREQERLAKIEHARREREHLRRQLEEGKLKRAQDNERAKQKIEQEKLHIAKKKQRIEFLKLVFFGKKQEGVIKAVKSSRSILSINTLLEKGHNEVRQGKIKRARLTYETTLKKYGALSIEEKKGVYGPITSFYNKLLEAENKHHRHEKLQKEQPLFVKWGLIKSKEQRENDRKAKAADEKKQQKIDEETRRKQEVQEAKQKKLQEIESKKQQEEAQRQEKRRLYEQKKQEAEERKQQLLIQKQKKKEEQEKKQQELGQQKQQERQKAIVKEEEKRRQEEAKTKEEGQKRLIREREEAQKKKQLLHKETERRITNLEQKSIELAQQKGKITQNIYSLVRSSLHANRKKQAELTRHYNHLEEKIRRMEQKQSVVENSLLKARKELLTLEGGTVNNLKLLFLPTSIRIRPQALPQFLQKTSEKTEQESNGSKGIGEETNKKTSEAKKASEEKILFARPLSKEELSKKSSEFRKYCYALLESEAAFNNGDRAKAKASYLKAREFYLALEYAEKTEAYEELKAAYAHLSQ